MKLEQIEKKFIQGNISNLSEKDIDMFIDEHWLEYTCKYNLSPCGDLTLRGKKEYLENNLYEIQNMIKEFPITLTFEGNC